MVDIDPSLPHELVDAFFMDIEPSLVAAGGGMTEVISLPGLYMIANIGLSFEVECLPGFAGESCVPVCSTDPCSNNGTCLQSVSGFTCACRGDFTGETCETRINDCQDVDCNDGTCVDGVLSFTCQCDPGFTGDFCEDGITTSVTTSRNVGVVAGTAVGVVLLVAILITIICIICIKVASGTSVLAVTMSSFSHVTWSPPEGVPISMVLACIYSSC